jgi:hypothetical protein
MRSANLLQTDLPAPRSAHIKSVEALYTTNVAYRCRSNRLLFGFCRSVGRSILEVHVEEIGYRPIAIVSVENGILLLCLS